MNGLRRRGIRSKVFKISRALGLSFMLRQLKGNDVTVLSLHRISHEQDFFFDPIRPELFEAIIKYCLRHYEIVSFAGIRSKASKPQLVLSFDDGYYDFIEYAIPILKRYSLPANHNLVNACLNSGETIWTQRLNDIFNVLKTRNITDDVLINGLDSTLMKRSSNWSHSYLHSLKALLKMPAVERNNVLNEAAARYHVNPGTRMMTWADARYCAEQCDIEIGCHTYNHNSLSTLYSEADFDLEIGSSLTEMEAGIGKKVQILAAPNGQYNQQSLDYARSKGIIYFLLVDDKTTPASAFGHSFSPVSRIYLVNESLDESIMRIERFYAKMKQLI